MFCVVGDLPTGPNGNAITQGRIVVFDSAGPGPHWQFHEFGHVVDQVGGGYDRFMKDYAVEATFADLMNLDAHDGNVLEMWS